MYYNNFGIRKKILLSLLFVVSALFAVYIIVEVYFFNKIKENNSRLYKEYNAILSKTIEKDNLAKEELFLKTIANYGVSVLQDPNEDVINCQQELGKFLCMFYDYKLLTTQGKDAIIQKYFIPKQKASAYRNENKYVFWGKDINNNNNLKNSADAIFFTLDSLKILKQSSNSLIKSVFLRTINNLCIVYPVNEIFDAETDFNRLVNFSSDVKDKTQNIAYINDNGNLVLGIRFLSEDKYKYDFIISSVIDYRLLMKNICNYAWKRDVDASVLLDKDGKVIFFKCKSNMPELNKLVSDGMNLYEKKGTEHFLSNINYLKSNNEGFISFTSLGKEFYAGFSTVKNLNWKLIFITSGEDINLMLSDLKNEMKDKNAFYSKSLNRQMINIQSIIFAVLIFIFIIFIILSLSISGKLTKSISELYKGVQKISSGDMQYKIPLIKSGDEIEKLISVFNNMVDSINNYIKDLAASIKARQEVEADIKIGAEIQNSMLPKNLPIAESLNIIDLEVASTLIPSKTISGDFYDYFMVNEDTAFFVIGDVSGKGVPASLFMVTIKTLLKEYVLSSSESLKSILLRLNNSISRDNYSCMFVTLFCGRINIKTGFTEYVTAGHEYPILKRNNENSVSFFSKVESTLLGIFKKGVKFSVGNIILEKGDFILLYTDGITESKNNKNEFFGTRKLLESVKKSSNLNPGALIEKITSEVAEFTEKSIAEDDDFTILILKRNN